MARYSETVGTQRRLQNQLHIAGQPNTAARGGNADIGGTNGASRVPAARLKAISIPVRAALPEGRRTSEPVPIWLAVLEATSCEAQRNGEYHAVRWQWDSGRAVYTNSGEEPEHIEPLGVRLQGGHTMAVYWIPGETGYTVEVYRQKELCA
jgi:hypothetical protein